MSIEVTKAAARVRRRPSPMDLLDLGERYGLLLLAAIVVLYFSLTDTDTFATAANWRIIAGSQAVVVVIALALTLPLISGSFDLSVGSVTIASSVLLGKLMAEHHWALIPAGLLAIGFGALIGAINGLLVTRASVNGLIATLGTGTVLGGIVQWYSNNESISDGISTTLTDFGTENIFGVPRLAAAALLVAAVVAYLLTQTPFGRRLTAIGSSADAAALVGIRVSRLTFLSFVIAGGLAGLAGVLLVAQQGSTNPTANGVGVLLPALAAVFLGSTAFRPGTFNVPGTIVALVLVAVIVSGLTLAGAQPWVEPVAQGLALLIAVVVSSAFRRQRRGG
jgi:ribose transport system permease protein